MYEMVLFSDPPVELLLEGLVFLLSEGSYTQSRWACSAEELIRYSANERCGQRNGCLTELWNILQCMFVL